MNAKLLSLLFLFFSFTLVINAQTAWQANGTNLYYRNGNVGIGTTAPRSPLEVSGRIRAQDVRINSIIGIGLGDWAPLSHNGVTTVEQYSLGWITDPLLPKGYALWVSSYAGMKFFTEEKPRLTITLGGYIGIGTEDPKYKLDVIGTIRAKEIRVDTNGADFVFEDDYELPTLDEVASHIQEKKHLPGIASAKEMQEDGVGLAELNVKLLQKIEELTLYVIQQEKKSEKQQKHIESLQGKIDEILNTYN